MSCSRDGWRVTLQSQVAEGHPNYLRIFCSTNFFMDFFLHDSFWYLHSEFEGLICIELYTIELEIFPPLCPLFFLNFEHVQNKKNYWMSESLIFLSELLIRSFGQKTSNLLGNQMSEFPALVISIVSLFLSWKYYLMIAFKSGVQCTFKTNFVPTQISCPT